MVVVVIITYKYDSVIRIFQLGQRYVMTERDVTYKSNIIV